MLIPIPGTMFFITVPDRIACEFVTAVPLLSVACLLLIWFS